MLSPNYLIIDSIFIPLPILTSWRYRRKLVQLMFSLIAKFSGKQHADLIRRHFYNIIGKVYILFQVDNAEIQRQIAPLREPNFLFASYFLEQLREKEISKLNTAAILHLLKEAAANVEALLPTLFKEETVQKAKTIIELFQQENFIDFVLKC